MRYLLDTNVLSEGVKPHPDAGVATWLREQSPFDLLLSSLTLGEIRKGVELRSDDLRRAKIEHWLTDTLPEQFRGRVLPVDDAVALEWGRLAASGQRAGRALPAVDGLLLATAKVHGLTFVTRNTRDCAGRGVVVLDPWSAPTDE
jgi:predicted nucleic acid-binding protein